MPIFMFGGAPKVHVELRGRDELPQPSQGSEYASLGQRDTTTSWLEARGATPSTALITIEKWPRCGYVTKPRVATGYVGRQRSWAPAPACDTDRGISSSQFFQSRSYRYFNLNSISTFIW